LQKLLTDDGPRGIIKLTNNGTGKAVKPGKGMKNEKKSIDGI